MGSLLSSWKTSLAGIVAGVLVTIGQTYNSSMTFKQWGMAIATGLSTALIGIFAKDHGGAA